MGVVGRTVGGMEVGMAPKITTLETLTDREIRNKHDLLVAGGGRTITPTYYLEELARRRADRQARMLTYLTVVITVLTASNVVLVAIDVL
jgi:hypothetical protein